MNSLGKQIYSEDNIRVPLLEEIGIKNYPDFHVIQWHNKFDALLGSEDLLKLGSSINYRNNILEIGNGKIPFFF